MTNITKVTQFELKKYAYTSDLKSRALNVFIYLVDRTNKELTCFPSIATIGKNLHISVSTVKRAMKELVEKGFLMKEARFSEMKNGGQTSNLYYLSIPTETPNTVSTKDENIDTNIKYISFDTLIEENKATEDKVYKNTYEDTYEDTDKCKGLIKDENIDKECISTKVEEVGRIKSLFSRKKEKVKSSFLKLKSLIYSKVNPTPVQFDTAFNLPIEDINNDKRSNI